MGRNNPRLVYHTLWVGKLLNNQQVVYRTKIIRFYWRFSNRCFHGIIHPLKNGLDISNSFQGLGKLFVDWVFFCIEYPAASTRNSIVAMDSNNQPENLVFLKDLTEIDPTL